MRGVLPWAALVLCLVAACADDSHNHLVSHDMVITTEEPVRTGHNHIIGVYFTGTDVDQIDPAWEPKMQTAMELMQRYYADRMAAAGYGAKTFRMKRAPNGRPKVYLVRGELEQAAYQGGVESWSQIHSELSRRFDFRESAVAVMSPGAPSLGGGNLGLTGDWLPLLAPTYEGQQRIFCDAAVRNDGEYGRQTVGQLASLRIGGYAHELGHVFGLPHSGVPTDLMSAGFWGFGAHFVDCPAIRWEASTLEGEFTARLQTNAYFAMPEEGEPEEPAPEVGGADLQVRNLSVRSHTRRRTNLRVRAKVCNEGDTEAGRSVAALKMAAAGRPLQSARTASRKRIGRIKPGRCRAVTLYARGLGSSALPLRVWVLADERGQVAETDESNQSAGPREVP